ncbi:MAG TPA: DUF4347 domain-containing protein, partial [Burkholderiales bacterium]|nr:DUF4347 domain-containing protein [Burkholderiales bacterium]
MPAAAVPTARPHPNDASRESSDAASDRTPAIPRTPAKPRTAAKARTPAKTKAPPFARKVVIEELEPRLLLSADLNPAAQDTLFATPAMQGAEYRALVEPGSQPVVTSMAVAPIQRTNELVFVDTATHDYQQLIDDMRENALAQGRDLQFVLIDPQQDGIRKITDTLAQNANLDAIHIISHAVDGAVQLGSAQLDLQTLAQRSTAIKTWGNALTEDGDLLIYGCDLAASREGQSLVNAIAALTGADVAASEDPTGAAARGGNWKLEFTTGKIETPVAVSEAEQAAWDGLLAAPVVDLNGVGTFTATDTFGTANSYTGGSNWSSGWLEFDASPTRYIAGNGNSDNNPTDGNVLYGTNITTAGGGTAGGQEIGFVGHGSQFNDSIQRSVNLLSYTSATLTFTYRITGIEAPDAVAVQVSKDGGATFTTLATYNTNTAAGNGNFDISSYISDKTVVRFAVTGGFGETDDRFFFDNVTITATGRNYDTTFTEGGGAVAIAGAGATVSDPDGSQIQSATVTLNNAQAGDVLAVSGTLPMGITASVSGNVLTLSGLASGANYAAALKQVTFNNTSAAPNTTTRNLSVRVTDATSEQSVISTAYVRVVSVDSPAVAQPDTFTAPNSGTVSGNVLVDNGSGADSDPDAVAPLTVSTTPIANPTQGTVAIASDGSFTYTPTGTGSYTDTFQYRLVSLAQVPGTTYEYWSAPPTGNSLATGFPTTAPNATGFLSGYDVDQAALNFGNNALDNFTVRFTSQFNITTAGTYTFYSGSDDGSRLYIDGNLVVNNDGAHSYAEVSNTAALTAGQHTIRVDFFEVTGQEDLVVSYSGADTSNVKTNMSGAVGMLAPSYATGTVTINVTSASAPILDLDSTPSVSTSTSTATSNLVTNGDMSLVTSNVPTGWTEGGDTGDGVTDNGRYAWTGTSGSAGNPTATLSQTLTVPANTSTTTYASTSSTLTQTTVATTNAITSIQFDFAWANTDTSSPNDNTLQVSYGGTVYATFTSGAGNGSTTGTWVYSNGATGSPGSVTAVADVTNATVTTSTVTITLGTPVTTSGSLVFTFGNGPSGGGTDDIVIDNVAVTNTATTTTTVAIIDLASNGWTTTYTENGTPVAIADTDSSIFDRDSANMASASITLTNPQTGDRLLVNGSTAASGTLASGIAWTRTATTVTLSGSFSKDLYADAIELIQFDNTTDTPSTTPRLINVTANDGALTSNTAVATINVVAVNDAPVFTGTAGASYTENAAAVAIVASAAVSDVDAANFNGGSVTVA